MRRRGVLTRERDGGGRICFGLRRGEGGAGEEVGGVAQASHDLQLISNWATCSGNHTK